MHNRGKGDLYETKTIEYIESLDFNVLDRNYYSRFGELDIIAKDENTLVFIEVKYRSNGNYGHPSESIHYYKRRNIINTAMWYMKDKRLCDYNVRFDVAIWHKGKIEYYKGAFDSYEWVSKIQAFR